MLKRVITIFSILTSLASFSQNQNPSSIKWRQIKTDNFVFVFPKEVEEKGILTANLLGPRSKCIFAAEKTATEEMRITAISKTAIAPYSFLRDFLGISVINLLH